MNVPECRCGADRVRGEETGPSRNPHNNWPFRQFWCTACRGVFSEPTVRRTQRAGYHPEGTG